MKKAIGLISLLAAFNSYAFSLDKPYKISQAEKQGGEQNINPTQEGLIAFGLRLGEPFNVRECKLNSGSYSGYFGYEVMPRPGTGPCLKFSTSNDRDSQNYTATLEWPLGESPRLTTGMLVSVIDGNLEGVGFNTSGVSTDEMVLDMLIKKYGQPTTLQRGTVKNGIGNTFPAIVAGWSTQKLDIVYQSIATKIDSGLVNIDTKKNSARRKAILEKYQNSRPGL